MKTQQKALIVKTAPESTHGLDELNVHLGRGWQVVHLAPMGGAGVGAQDDAPSLWLAALVIIEREEEQVAEVVEQAQEKTEEIVDDVVEGNGAGPELPDELEERNGGPLTAG